MPWYKERQTQLRDFIKFGRAVIHSGDVDPQFPLLRGVYKQLNLDANTAIWYTCLYLVYYHLGSAIQAWERYPEPTHIRAKEWETDLPYSKQRRCFRGNDGGRRQLNTIVEASNGDIYSWIWDLIVDHNEEKNWTRIREAATEIPYHGPWSSYKLCDMLKFVHDFPITAPDIGTKPGATAGPIAGLVSLTGLDRTTCSNDTNLHLTIRGLMLDAGVKVDGLDQVESVLCDWQSIINGRYYLGHDIDRDLGQIDNAGPLPRDKVMLAVRGKIFDDRLLGEKHDWSGMRLDLNRVYRVRRRFVNNFADVRFVEMRRTTNDLR